MGWAGALGVHFPQCHLRTEEAKSDELPSCGLGLAGGENLQQRQKRRMGFVTALRAKSCSCLQQFLVCVTSSGGDQGLGWSLRAAPGSAVCEMGFIAGISQLKKLRQLWQRPRQQLEDSAHHGCPGVVVVPQPGEAPQSPGDAVQGFGRLWDRDRPGEIGVAATPLVPL